MPYLRSKVLEIQERWLNFVKNPAYRLQAESLRTVSNLLTELMYIEPGQFILEFLQNAEDALMEAGKKGYFKVELYRDKVVISNNGKPFVEEDLESLCAIASRKKPALGYKGFIGIGWKSVYKVSNHVEVCSADTCFEFNEDFWKRPEAHEILKNYNLKPEEVLWQLTPIPTEPTETLPKDETRFTVYFKNSSLSNEIAKVLDELTPSIFLFLDHVNKILISDYVNNKHKRIEWSVEKEEEFDDVKVRVIRVHVLMDGSAPTWSDFLVFKKEFKVPENIRMDPVSVKAKRSDVIKREVAVAFELDPGTDDLKPIEETRFWLMYSFLPLTEVKTGLKFLIQADFIVHPGRRYINVEAKWNQWMMQCIAELLKTTINYLMKKYKKSYLMVFDYKPLGDEIWYKFIEPYIIKTIDEVLNDPVVLCYKGHEVRLSQVVKASGEVYEIIKYGLLDEGDLRYIYGVEKHILDSELKLRKADEDKVSKLTLVDLLNENLLRAFMSRSITLLSKVYELAYGIKINIPPEKRFIVTSPGELKLASNVYIPKIPEHIIEIGKKFPEVNNYLKSLDFVHEEMMKLINEVILKWFGVKEVSLKEIAEKIILEHIVARNPPPDREKLLAATLLVKQAGIVIVGPIWVLTKEGSIEISDNVWNPELFIDSEDVAKILNVELLDIDAYKRYDGDVGGWAIFFANVVRGYILYDCQYYYSRRLCTLRGYVWDLVNKIKEALEETSIDDNIKLVRLLYRLYWYSSEAQWDRVRVKLVTDEDSFAYSDQLLLHDVYSATELWCKWKARGFSVGPFVSPKYVKNPDARPYWKIFFVEVLGVKDSVGSEVIERFAEWFVEGKLGEKGYRIINKGGECDFKIDVNGEIICVEIKGRRKSINELEVDLTESEVKTAMELKDKYWLTVVESIPNNPRAWVLRNPVKLVTWIKFHGKDIKNYGEVLGDE
ncbi:MAG: DUF3883 domain-containing protein [Desulfurococcales archaeon]|jgi:hypothetical protein|nr:DUF3883 domain-containing protein [Desulfurococcales archaeon]